MKYLVFFLISIVFLVKTNAQEITMFSGFFDYQYYQDDERIAKKDLVKLLETNEESLVHWNRSKTFSTLSWVALAAETGFAIWEIADNTPFEDESNNTITTVGVFGSLAAVITFGVLSHTQKKKAILKYNQGIQENTAFKIMPSKKGIGIAIVF